MRAAICYRFGGYTFEMLDDLDLNKILEIYSSVEWLADEERKAMKKR